MSLPTDFSGVDSTWELEGCLVASQNKLPGCVLVLDSRGYGQSSLQQPDYLLLLSQRLTSC